VLVLDDVLTLLQLHVSLLDGFLASFLHVHELKDRFDVLLGNRPVLMQDFHKVWFEGHFAPIESHCAVFEALLGRKM